MSHIYHDNKEFNFVMLWFKCKIYTLYQAVISGELDRVEDCSVIYSQGIHHEPIDFHYKFRTFSFILASYSKIPTQYFYFEKLLPGPMDTLNPGRKHLK